MPALLQPLRRAWIQNFFVGFSYGLNTAVVTMVLFRDIIQVVSANTQCRISEVFG